MVLGLAGALDDWWAIRRRKRDDAAGAQRLLAAARVADPDPWRNELRTRLDRADTDVLLEQQALQALAKAAKFEELGPISLHLLGTALSRCWRSQRRSRVGAAEGPAALSR